MEPHNTEPRAAWLSPSQALNRFQLPQELVTEVGTFAFQHLRYGFALGKLGLLIDPDTSAEVIDRPAIFALPNTPAWLLGLINLRGNLVPIFDLQRLFALTDEQQEPAQQRILVIDEGARAVGVLIDELPELPDLERKLARLPPLPTPLTGHVNNAYLSAGRVWLDFKQHQFFQSLAMQMASA